MTAEQIDREFTRRQVLRGLVLNCAEGYHFAGKFLDFSFDHVGREQEQPARAGSVTTHAHRATA